METNKWRRRQNNHGIGREDSANENIHNKGQNRNRTRQINRDNTQTNRNRSQSGVRNNNHEDNERNRNRTRQRNRSHSRVRNNNREDNGQSSNNRNDNRKRWMGFKYIENLLEETSEEIAMKLMNDQNGLGKLTKDQISGDLLVLLIKLSKKVCQSAFNESKYIIIQIIFNGTFLSTLTTFIATLPTQNEQQRRRNSWFWKDTDEFWSNLLYICEDLLNAIPTVGCRIAGEILKTLKIYLPLFENIFKLHVADEIKQKIDFLIESVEILKIEVEEKAINKHGKNTVDDDDDDIEPPDDFRTISIYPSPTELKGKCEFLRSNVIEGAYKNINHYLDVQFRLLREDFVAPLRKGIQNYLFNMTATDKKRLENIRIYRQIRFLRPETVGQNYSIRIRFNFSTKKKSFNYENSKRFMFGSLLCFTNDLFQTILFGRVEQRKLEDLKNGELIVGFDKPTNVLFDRDYMMVESNVYFEPYYHVLSVLQRLTIEHFPMERYLIYCESLVTPPRYLTAEQLRLLQSGLEQPRLEKIFNESQLRAFAAALTQEFVLIQGPPGTGKTYVGLKIAKALLEKREHWYKRTPMFVICFTNHALDQFLEGLLPTTKNLIRVGGQSKNENLNKYNLRERKRTNRRRDAAIIDKTLEIRQKLAEIKSWTEHLHDLERYNSVITFNAFKHVVDGFENSWFSKATDKNVFEWLFGGRDVQEDEEIPDIIHKMDAMKINNAAVGGAELPEDENEDDDDDDNNDDDDPTAAQLIDDEIFTDDYERIPLSMASNLTSLKKIGIEIEALERKLTEIDTTDVPPLERFLYKTRIEQELRYLYDNYDYLQKRLEQGRLKQFDHPSQINLQNPHNMRPYLRWALYFDWLEQYKRKIIEKLSTLDIEFRQIYKVYEELRDMEDVRFMQEAYVIGMTTTCAARLRTSLQALKSPIVIVEEAAEVLEAHIVAALTPNCQHLILIGDHQQLKPSAADYRIETQYKLGVSLFERMVLNKIQCFTLNIQHRMRPEISSLVTTTIYPFLNDHPSVERRPQILGTDHVLYFINHQNFEVECDDNSKKNMHEAEFLLAYANHLILNGYKTDNITVIAAYLGQMFEMQRIRKRYHLLKNLRIAVLDNYQGEECDIILLSLVRSNKDNKIGFLKIENRVCVALSRARNGMFIMGNMKQLVSQSDLWAKINDILKKQDAIDDKLPLRCEVHTDYVTYVKTADDFAKIPEGGCNQKCNFPLACQHYCTKICHIVDRSHAEYKCREKCNRQLCDKDESHKCIDMCYKECRPCYYLVLKKLLCGHEVHLQCSEDEEKYKCTVLVPTVLQCGHETEKPCHYDTNKFPCPHPCEIKVEPCGHSCLLTCHVNNDPDHLQYRCKKKCARFMKNCTQKLETHICNKLCHEECDECNIIVQKKRTECPHIEKVPCSVDVDKIDCEKPCTKILECGHKCKNKCKEPCGNCKEKVDKSIPICGHVIKTECSKEPDRKNCKRNCPLQLPCGHPCTKKCHEPCTTQCEFIVDDSVIGDCGHIITQSYCYMKTTNDYSDVLKLLKLCKEPCTAVLKCDHKCTGNCGECYQSRLHKRCNEKCGVPLICNHECQFPCRSACRPCRLPCSFRCGHSKCSKLCGEPCTPCKEPCVRSCKHQKCRNKCGFICDVEPCKEPCDLQLECGHDCVGFCNEPCPPCRICDTDGTYELFFGTEDEADAKFVVLNDCKHTIENSAMEHWLGQDNDNIGFKTCPKCKSLIKTTQRYSDYVKRAHVDIVEVQKRSVGSQKNNDTARKDLLQKFLALEQLPSNILHLTSFGRLIKDLIKRLRTAYRDRRQKFDKFILNGIERKYQIIQEILEICKLNETKIMNFDKLFHQQLDFITIGLKRDTDFISDQEVEDVQQEIPRLLRIYEYNKLQQSTVFKSVKQYNTSVKNLVVELEKFLLKPTRYVMDKKIQDLLKQINTNINAGLTISETERRQILSAMNLTKGHWFKCPNGHIYAIGECGGAMEVSKCNECGAIIGGQHHQLRHDNQLAREMDGASHAAWSEQANLQNYGII